MALKPIYDAVGIERINVSTYQAVSGTGKEAIDELWLGTKTMVGTEETLVGKIMPFLDCSGRMIDGGVDPVGLARTENWLGLILFLALCVFVYFDCRRAKPELGEGELG